MLPKTLDQLKIRVGSVRGLSEVTNHLVRSRILICGWHYMHKNLDRLLSDTLHHKLALVIVLNGRVLQKVRGQIRSKCERPVRSNQRGIQCEDCMFWHELPNHFRQETSLEHFKNIITFLDLL
jgi:hypothetical protein